MTDLGILGVGHLAGYCVRGLRNSDDQRSILLSPRGEAMARHLAAECYCNIADSNQQVVDQCDIILLAVRPMHLDDLLQTINFRPGQTVISVIAGISLEQLRQYPALQQTELVRALPSTSAEVNAGPIPLFPSNPLAEELFASLGQVVTLTSEALFDTALAHACLHGWSYFLIQALIDWSTKQGMDPTTARQMVVHSISSSITFAEANPTLSYKEIGDAIATEGTFTRKGIEQIKSDNGIQSWIDAMESMK
ncbi:NAD(P)-binding domain-containing protein [Neptunomonas antarctica]|uniref:Pyrroline-5-carboxylate reductase n=1 Tax=Neptunomonas antarctica TaxID=619304 RepID=A0A1N7LH48_9GAMM|nr:NAD(P)-binding domain-containing protein [Neptunomonas antarctica]SIS73137.1 pyrroline-5-carboxylate reductase [Neptunomonas antarctica]